MANFHLRNVKRVPTKLPTQYMATANTISTPLGKRPFNIIQYRFDAGSLTPMLPHVISLNLGVSFYATVNGLIVLPLGNDEQFQK